MYLSCTLQGPLVEDNTVYLSIHGKWEMGMISHIVRRKNPVIEVLVNGSARELKGEHKPDLDIEYQVD